MPHIVQAVAEAARERVTAVKTFVAGCLRGYANLRSFGRDTHESNSPSPAHTAPFQQAHSQTELDRLHGPPPFPQALRQVELASASVH